MMFIRNLISIMNLYLIIVFNNISTYITCSNFDLPIILQNIVEACLIHSEFRNKELNFSTFPSTNRAKPTQIIPAE